MEGIVRFAALSHMWCPGIGGEVSSCTLHSSSVGTPKLSGYDLWVDKNTPPT